MQGPFRQYVPNLLWMIINVFCLGLTFLQLRRLSREVRGRRGGEGKVRLYWIIAITHASFWSPLYLETSTAWGSSLDRRSVTDEVWSLVSQTAVSPSVILIIYTAALTSPGLHTFPGKPSLTPHARLKLEKNNFINLWLPGRF